MGSIFYGGSILMKGDKYSGAEDDFYGMTQYLFEEPTVILDGCGEEYFPQCHFSWSDDSVVLVRGKYVITYTKSSFAELLAKDEEGNIVWMDGRSAPYAGCWKGEYLDEVRGAVEYTIAEYDLETSKKRKYKVTLDAETPFNYWDVKKLLDFVDADTLKDKFLIENGILTLYCGEDTDLVIPESTTAIGYHAFSKPYSFNRIVLPKTVVDIPLSMLEMCKTKSIEVAEDNPKYCVRNGCLIDKESSTLVWCFSGNVIPDDGSIKRIGSSAFYQREDLESIILPKTVTEISSYAFHECKNLKNVKVPNSIEVIGRNAFAYCDALESECIPERFGNTDDFSFPKRKRNDDDIEAPRTLAGFPF